MSQAPAPVTLSLEQAHALATSVLTAAGADPRAAQATASALVRAEAQGLSSHGLSRLPQYAGFLRNGRCNAQARPAVIMDKPSSALIDADNGLAFPACALAIELGIDKARANGSACVAVTNSHHFGVAADHLGPVAQAGMVGIALGNSPAAMPVPGGHRAIMGTNPLAACFPREHDNPIMIDLSMSEVARGKIMVAASQGQPIPSGWALDANGQPTTDARAALAGSMLPLGAGTGSAKGGLIALMIELLAITLTGAHFGAQADSFFQAEGNQPRLGQVFLIIDPAGFAGHSIYHERIDALVAAMQAEPGVRLPGVRRAELADAARRNGILVAGVLHAQLIDLQSRS